MKQLRVINSIFAVVAILLAGFAIYLAIQWDATKRELRDQRVTLDSLFTNYEIARTQSSQASGLLRALSDSNVRHIKLTGMPRAPDAKAFIYWNKANHQVYLNPLELRQLEDGEYYQLWSLRGDNALSLGLIDMEKDPYLIQRMRDVAKVDEFVISIVEGGERNRPRMEQVVVSSR